MSDAATGDRSTGRTLGVALVAVALVVVSVSGIVTAGSAASGGVDGGPPDWEPTAEPIENRNATDNDTARLDRPFAPPGGSSGITGITADRLIDKSPALTATAEGYVVVWQRQMADKELTEGRDIFWSRYSDGEWSSPSPITDDLKYDTVVDVAYDPQSGRAVAVWNKIDVVLGDDETQKDLFKYLDQSEIYYATFDGTSWSDPKALTDNDRIDLSPQVVASDGTFHVGWRADDEIGGGPFDLQYTSISGGETGDVGSLRVESLVWGMSPDPEGGFTVGYLAPNEPESRNGTIEVYDVTGSATKQSSYEVSNLGNFDVGPRGVTWTTVPQEGEWTAYFASEGSVEQVPFERSVDRPGNLRLDAVRGDSMLLFEGQFNGSLGYFYKVRHDGRWLVERLMNSTVRPEFEFSDAELATSTDDFGIVFRGKQKSNLDANADLFGVVQKYLPDLTVGANASAEARNASLGEDVTISYRLRNTGVAVLDGQVEVALVAGDRVVETKTVDAGAVGLDGSVEGTFTAPLPDSGRLTVRADPGDDVAELSETNNEATVVMVSPDVTVGDVNTTRSGSTVSITATINNVGGANAGPVGVTLKKRQAVLDRRTVASIPAGGSTTVQFETDVETVGSDDLLIVLDAPADENLANDVGAFRPLSPDIELFPNQVTFDRQDGTPVMSVLVVNRGPGGTTFPLEVGYPDGGAFTSVNVSIAGATGGSDIVSKRVTVELPSEALGKRITLLADAEADPDLGNNAAQVTVPANPGAATPTPTQNQSDDSSQSGGSSIFGVLLILGAIVAVAVVGVVAFVWIRS